MMELIKYPARPLRQFVPCSLSLLLGLLSLAVAAAPLTITVQDQQGEPLEYAVVEAQPLKRDLATPVMTSAKGDRAAVVAQDNRTFVPFVSAIPAHSNVSFPNLDKTRHHVYSFSEAKAFELKLFVGHKHEPVEFHTPGIVAIGCNIHDYMQAYIYVAASAYVGVTNQQGQVVLPQLPDHPYQLKVWHPWQTGVQAAVEVAPGDNVADMRVSVRREPLPAPPDGGLQNLFNP